MNIVGDTAKARKGVGNDLSAAIFQYADSDFFTLRKTGVGSGEGIIAALADEYAKDDDGNLVLVATKDCRILIVEQEFGRLLTVAGREGLTVSSVLRAAWDGNGRLQIIVRKNPLKVTESHLVLVGHITLEELKIKLADVDIYNGMANRCLWVWHTRAWVLPSGGNLTTDDFRRLGARVACRLTAAREIDEMYRTPDAVELRDPPLPDHRPA